MRYFRVTTDPQYSGISSESEVVEVPDGATQEEIDAEVLETAHELVSRVCMWYSEEIDANDVEDGSGRGAES